MNLERIGGVHWETSPKSITLVEQSYYSHSPENTGEKGKKFLTKIHSQSKSLIPNQPHALPIILENMHHQFPHKMKGRQSNSLASYALSLFLWLQIEHLGLLTHISYQTTVARSRFRLLFQHWIRPGNQKKIYLVWSLDGDISYRCCVYAQPKRSWAPERLSVLLLRASETLRGCSLLGLIKLSFCLQI